MSKITEQLQEFSDKYKPYGLIIFNNMRLVLLIVFGLTSAYLVLQINSLINEPLPPNTETSKISKKPDQDVITIFKELQSKPVSLESEYLNNRENPF